MPFGKYDTRKGGLFKFLGPRLYHRYTTVMYRQRLKAKIYDHYGKKCARCGFSDERALQIDHVNGDGHQERTRGGKHNAGNFNLKWVLKNPERYQLLCANCNWIKRHENNETPKTRFDWANILKDFTPKKRIPLSLRKRCRNGHVVKSGSVIFGRNGKQRCKKCVSKKIHALKCGWCKEDFMSNRKTSEFCSKSCAAHMRNYIRGRK